MPVFGRVTVIGHFQPIILFLSSTQIFNSTGKTVNFWPVQCRANADRIICEANACDANGKLSKCWKKWCPGWESNPHEEKSPEDFKSSASAIPPPGHWQYKLNESKDLVQHRHLSRWLLKDSGVGSGVGWTLYRSVQPLYGGQRVLRRKMRISHGHANGFVAEKLLHGENVHSGHYEAAGKRVTEAVPAKIRNLRVLENRLKPTPRLARATADEFRGRGYSLQRFSSALTAARFSGTCLMVPFLLRGIVRVRRGRETFSHSKPYCSLRRRPVLSAKSNSGRRSEHFSSIDLRSAVSSSVDRNRMRALSSSRCGTSRAGFSFTLPLRNCEPVGEGKQRTIA